MGVPRTLPAVVVNATSPVPAYSGSIIPAVSFSILNGIATIVLGTGNLPANGYNGPNGFGNVNSNGSSLQLYGGSPSANGQQVTLWGFTTATYFNGRTITVLDNDPISGSFRFYFDNADVASTADAGNTAASPFQHYRTVRIELDAAASTNIVYVGDLNVSASQYLTALSLTGVFSIEIASENIPADRIWLIASAGTPSVHVSLIY